MAEASTRSEAQDAPYWRALEQGGLVMQCCKDCGRWCWPAACRCGDCGAWDPPWREIAFEGRLFSWAVTFQPFGGTEAIGVPFTTVLVELPHAGGRRLLGLFDGEEAQLSVGAPMKGQASHTPIRDAQIPSIRWRLA